MTKHYVPSATAADEVIGDAIRDAFQEFIGHDNFVVHWGRTMYGPGWSVAVGEQRYQALEIGGAGSVSGWQFTKI